jgi:hypothetical protein
MTEHSQQEFCGVEFLAEDDLESVISSQQKPVLLACLLPDQHYIANILTLALRGMLPATEAERWTPRQ